MRSTIQDMVRCEWGYNTETETWFGSQKLRSVNITQGMEKSLHVRRNCVREGEHEYRKQDFCAISRNSAGA